MYILLTYNKTLALSSWAFGLLVHWASSRMAGIKSYLTFTFCECHGVYLNNDLLLVNLFYWWIRSSAHLHSKCIFWCSECSINVFLLCPKISIQFSKRLFFITYHSNLSFPFINLNPHHLSFFLHNLNIQMIKLLEIFPFWYNSVHNNPEWKYNNIYISYWF